jgi:hypothetical protein
MIICGLVVNVSYVDAEIERKIADILGEDQFGFRRGKVTRDAIGMMRIIVERTLEIAEELCVCFID